MVPPLFDEVRDRLVVNDDAHILAQCPVELALANVNGVHACGFTL